MISLILEDGARLRRLTLRQMREVKEAFLLYLIHAISFREAMNRCQAVLEDDQIDERNVIRERLAAMIEDHYCNTVVKPAVILLARGDASMFRAAGFGTRFCRSVIAKYPREFRRMLKTVCFDDIRSANIKRLEAEYLEKVVNHSRSYVMRKARFLMSAEHGLSMNDMVSDLQLLALRSFRWYFPFRSGLHMLNTMRATISNRGKSMVKYNVADSRRRLIALDNGETYNREASGSLDDALNSSRGSSDPTSYLDMRLSLQKIGKRPQTQPIVQFVSDPESQDRFISWAGHRYGVWFDSMEQLSTYIREQRLSYPKVLSRFLRVSPELTKTVLNELRSAV